MKPFALLIVGVVVGWAASGVDWSRKAIGEESIVDAASPNPAESLEAPASDNPKRPRQWPRRVFETRMVKDANGNLHPVTVSRLVNADGSIGPETPVGQQQPYFPPVNDQINATAFAHPPVSGLVGRFQASAYGSPSGHGCYVVDTTTGKTWHVAPNIGRQVITEALVQSPPPTPAARPWLTPDHQPPAGMSVAPTPNNYVEPPRPTQSSVVPTPKPELAEPESDDAN